MSDERHYMESVVAALNDEFARPRALAVEPIAVTNDTRRPDTKRQHKPRAIKAAKQ